MSEAKSNVAAAPPARGGFLGIRPRPGPVRFDDDRGRVDDRLGHLHRFRGHRAQRGVDRRVAYSPGSSPA